MLPITPTRSWPRLANKIMKLIIFCCSILLTVLAFAACQRDASLDYVNYGNEEKVPRISVEDAKKDFEAGRAIFVDSRDAETYKNEHLPGAVNISWTSPEDEYDKLPKDKKIILYCS